MWIGVCLERSPELGVAWLAMLKAGGAFVPLDLVFPRERLAYLFADAGVRRVIAATGLRGRVPAGLPHRARGCRGEARRSRASPTICAAYGR